MQLQFLPHLPTQKTSGHFSGGLFEQLRAQIHPALVQASEQQDTVQLPVKTLSPKPPFFQGSIGAGIKRLLKKTLLRPRGWAELALAIAPGHVGLIFLAKSFLEGLVGVDSLFFRRRLTVPVLSVSKEYGGRTLWEVITQSFLGKPALPTNLEPSSSEEE